jgi:hypothetical protein
MLLISLVVVERKNQIVHGGEQEWVWVETTPGRVHFQGGTEWQTLKL